MKLTLTILFSCLFAGCLSAVTRQNQPEQWRHEHETEWTSAYPQLNQPKYGDVTSFQDGKEYRYLYEGQILTGMPDVHQQYSGVRVRAVVNIQLGASNGKDLMQIEKVFVGSIHERFVSDPMSLIPTAFVEQIPASDAPFEEALKKPIRFNYDNGKVKEFETTEEDPSWSINMKRAILTTFHLSLNEKEQSPFRQPYQTANGQPLKKDQDSEYPQVFTVMEDGAGGRCETSYVVMQTPDSDEFVYPQIETVNSGRPFTIPKPTNAQVLNVTKSYNFKNCEYRPFVAQGIHLSGMCPTCENKPEQWNNLIEAAAHTRYNISGDAKNFMIESAITEAIYKLTPKHHAAGSIVAYVNMTMTLISADSHKQPIQFPEQNSNIIDGLHMINPQFLEKKDENTYLYETPEAKNPIVQKKQFFPFVDEKPAMIKQIFEKFLKDLENPSEDSADATLLVNEMINYLRFADKKELQQIHEQIKSVNVPEIEKEEIEHMFLDILLSTGTNCTFTYIVELAEQKKIEGSLLVDTLSMLPMRLKKVDPVMIEKLYTLCNGMSKRPQELHFAERSCWLAYGTIVHQACAHKHFNPDQWLAVKENIVPSTNENKPSKSGKYAGLRYAGVRYAGLRYNTQQNKPEGAQQENQYENPWCPEETITKIVERSNSAWKQMNTEELKIGWLKSIKNMGLPEFIPQLEEIIEDESLPIYIRTQAIYALIQMVDPAEQEVYQILLPIYHSTTVPYQLRIAAYTVLIHGQPPLDILQSIAQKLNQEPMLEVASYVYSSMITIANLTDPCLRNFTQDLRTVLYLVTPVNTDLTHSKSIHKGMWSEYLKTGVFWELSTVADLDSIVPRSARFRVHANSNMRSMELIEFGYETQGFGQNIRNYIGNLTKETLEAITGSRPQTRHSRQASQSVKIDMADINQRLKLKTIGTKEMRGTAFFKLMGEETRFAVMNPDTVGRFLVELLGQSQQVLPKLTGEGYKMENRRVVMPRFFYDMPTVFGFPVFVRTIFPAVASMEGKIKVQLTPKPAQIDFSLLQHMPQTVKVDADFTTKFDGTHECTFGVYMPFIKIGAAHATKVSVEMPVKGSLLFKPAENLTRFVWDMPEKPVELVRTETYPATFVRRASVKKPSFQSTPKSTISKGYLKVDDKYSEEKRREVYEKQFSYENQYQQYLKIAQPQQTPQTPKNAAQKFINLVRYTRPTPLITSNGREEFNQWNGLPISALQVWEIPTNNFTKSAVYNVSIGHEAIGVKVDLDAQGTYPVGTPFMPVHPVGHKGYFRILAKPIGQVKSLIMSMYEKTEIVRAPEQELVNKLKDKMTNFEIKDTLKGLLTPPKDFDSMVKVGHSIQLFIQPSTTPAAQQPQEPAEPKKEGPSDYQMRILLGMLYSWDGRYFKAVAALDNKAAVGPKAACFLSEILYPERTGLWYLNKEQIPFKKNIEGHVEMSYGQQCGTENKVHIHMTAEASGEQYNLEKQQLYDESGIPVPYSVAHEVHEAEGLFQSQYKKCQADREEGAYFTPACVEFVKKHTDYLLYKFNVEYTKLSRPTLKLLQKAEQWFHYMYYWNTYVDEVDVYPEHPMQSPAQQPTLKKFNATIAFSADRRYVNVYYNTTTRKVEMINLRMAKEVIPLGAVIPFRPSHMLSFDAPSWCTIGGNKISTYDDLESEMPLSECYHLMTKDNSPDELFAVLAANIKAEAGPQELNKKIMVVLPGHQIEIVPPQGRTASKVSEYQVLINGQPISQPLTINKPITVPQQAPEHQSIAHIVLTPPESSGDKDPIVAIISRPAKLKVLFDGRSISVFPSIYYKNDLAGLCGNYNNVAFGDDVLPHSAEGQIERAEDEFEWSRSFIVQKDNCEADIPKDQKINNRQSKSKRN